MQIFCKSLFDKRIALFYGSDVSFFFDEAMLWFEWSIALLPTKSVSQLCIFEKIERENVMIFVFWQQNVYFGTNINSLPRENPSCYVRLCVRKNKNKMLNQKALFLN